MCIYYIMPTALYIMVRCVYILYYAHSGVYYGAICVYVILCPTRCILWCDVCIYYIMLTAVYIMVRCVHMLYYAYSGVYYVAMCVYIIEMYRMPKFRDPRMRMHMRISVHEDPGSGCTCKYQRMEIRGCECKCEYLDYNNNIPWLSPYTKEG